MQNRKIQIAMSLFQFYTKVTIWKSHLVLAQLLKTKYQWFYGRNLVFHFTNLRTKCESVSYWSILNKSAQEI